MARRHIRNAIESQAIAQLPQTEAKAARAAKGPTPPKRAKKRSPKQNKS